MQTPTPTEPHPSFAAALLASLRDAWWIYLSVPPLLTVVNLVGGGGGSSLLDHLVVNVSATLCIGVSTQATFVVAERRGWRLPWALHLPLLVIVGVAVGTELLLLLLSLFARFDPATVRRGAWLLGGTVAALSAAISVTYDRLRARARAIELREEQARRQALQARLDALRSRMNPHFLFNSLNTVAALIEEDPPAAVRAVEQLAELLRYTLEHGDEALVPLADELRCVDEYLALEAARFGERLRVDLRVAEDLAAEAVPPLTIQPLVENAIKHGVARSRTPVTVTMTVRGEGERLYVEIEDDGPGGGAGPALPSTGTAQRTLRERLQLLYGDAAELVAGPRPQGGYRAALRLPRHHRPGPGNDRPGNDRPGNDRAGNDRPGNDRPKKAEVVA